MDMKLKTLAELLEIYNGLSEKRLDRRRSHRGQS